MDTAARAAPAARAPYAERPSTHVPAVVWAATPAPGPQVILPDGCMDVIWTGEGLLVAGPDTGPVTYGGAPVGARLTALRLAPGVAPSLLGERADLLRDARVDLAALWPGDRVAVWTSALAASPRPGRTLEHLVAARLDERPPPTWAAPLASRMAAGDDVRRTAHDLGLGERTLRRLAREHVGYGPKLLQRVLRLQRTLAALRRGDDPSRVAADEGYADYAHLFRDVRALTGRRPTELRPVGSGQAGSAAYRSTPLPSGSATEA